MSTLAFVRDRDGKAIDFVVHATDVARFAADKYANARGWTARFLEFVQRQNNGFRHAIDFDANTLFPAAINDAISLDPVSMRRERFVAAPKMNACLATAADVVIPDQIVRIAVPESHSVIAMFDHILLVKLVLRAPAEVNPFGPALHPFAAHD